MNPAPDVVCLGILVADVAVRPVDGLPPRGTLALTDEISLHLGGCAANVATTLTRFGLQVTVVGKTGDDAFGTFVVRALDEHGIDRRLVLRDQNAPTSATVALVSSDGERTFLHQTGANAVLSVDELDRTQLYTGRVLHLAGALVLPGLDGEPSASVLREARERGILTVMDTVWDPTGSWDRVLPALEHLDLFCPSLTEARAITGQQEASEIAAWLRDRGVVEVALTMGEGGCYVAGDDFEGKVDGLSATPVDETGSGDAFAAGMIYGKLMGWGLARRALFANAAGALATTAMGAAEGVQNVEHVEELARSEGRQA